MSPVGNARSVLAADMLHNKLEEIETIANNENLDMIAVKETLLKNMPSDVKPEDFVFNIKGYNTVYNYKGSKPVWR